MMKDTIRKATEQERDRIKKFIESASQSWIGDEPGPAGRDGYIISLKAALENIEEALRIIKNS